MKRGGQHRDPEALAYDRQGVQLVWHRGRAPLLKFLQQFSSIKYSFQELKVQSASMNNIEHGINKQQQLHLLWPSSQLKPSNSKLKIVKILIFS